MREMKNSKIGWIGDIPKDWKTTRIKYILKESNIRSVEGNETPLSLGKVCGLIPSSMKEQKNLQSESYINTKVVFPGEIVFNRFKARLFAISDYHGVVSPDYAVYKDKGHHNLKYYTYLFGTDPYRSAFDNKASGIGDGFNRLYTNDLFSMPTIMPPIETQNQIVQYLDYNCLKIDDSIARYKALSNKLDEYRKAVITKAVTQGIRGERPMKQSNEVWIGQIPPDWSVAKIKYLVSLSGERAEANNGYLSMENVESWTGKFINTGSSAEGDTLKIFPGQVIFGKLRPYLAKAYLVKQEGCCSGEFLVFNVGAINASYFRYGLTTSTFVNRVDVSTYGTKMPRANAGFITNLLFPVPPKDEQAEIVAYLDKKCSDIDNSKAKIEAVVKKLEEYKKSLIYNAVTGKIEC